MTAGDLLISVCLPDEPTGSNIYGLVFDKNFQAIKLNGSDIWALTSYFKANHSSHAIALTEHPERIKCYHFTIAAADLDLPKTPRGEEYQIEFWKRAGATPDRDSDTFLEIRTLIWSGEYVTHARLEESQEDSLAGYIVHVGTSYDSSLQTVRFMVWLERNGELVVDPQQCELTWVSRTGVTLTQTLQTTYLTGADGVFSWDQGGIDLDPDEVSHIKIVVRDVDGVDHTSASSITSWD